MRIDLDGQVALLLGAETPVGAEIGRRLAIDRARVAAGTSRAVLDQFGRLDMVVNCEPLASSSDGETMLGAASAVLHEAATVMGTAGSGRIVTVIGSGAIVARRGEGARSAAMAGIASLTRSLALDGAANGVRVNAVAVGPGEDALSHTPLGRVPSLGSIANAVLFLLAPEASYVTGHVLVVDGGFSAAYVRNF